MTSDTKTSRCSCLIETKSICQAPHSKFRHPELRMLPMNVQFWCTRSKHECDICAMEPIKGPHGATMCMSPHFRDCYKSRDILGGDDK